MIEVVRNAVTVYQIQRLGGKFAAIQVKFTFRLFNTSRSSSVEVFDKLNCEVFLLTLLKDINLEFRRFLCFPEPIG